MPDDSRFCEACGSALPIRCASCGATSRAGARFCTKCGKTLTSDAATTPAKPADTAPSSLQLATSAERRQLTVMFCDLVGSTALSARLDPEDMREIIGAYHRCCADQITKAGGFVAKYMGDGVLAYFGYPEAHEDDAERAVRAGLALTDAVGQLDVPERLQVRAGIATGLVVVGDLVDQGDVRERAIVGETPNLAARLQALAEPNSVVIAASTRRLLGGLFEYEDLAPIEVKGFTAPVRASEVLRESGIESRFEALHSTAALTPLVGREEEIELLLRRWRRAKDGEGQVVLLTGEPGIGKSRLAAALQERIGSEPHTRLRYFCSPYHKDSALHPVIVQLEWAAGFDRNVLPAVKTAKLDAMLARTATPQEDAALLADLLSLPKHDRHALTDLTPQQKKEKTFAAVLRQLEGLARHRPMLMIFEDVHWIDPSSRELLDFVVERVPRWSVLLLVTFRPEFSPPWSGQAHVTTVTLARLDRREGAALVQRVVGNAALPSDVVQEIVERTDGVPLFVEELTKAVVEGGASGDDLKVALSATPSSALVVPATLHASLMARLDRLGPAAREVAQVGAAIGREFAYELLAEVVAHSELQGALDRLVGSGLVFCRGLPPQAAFLFKHALVQEAAYATLLRGQRQELHARVARALEERFSEIVQTQPELLAHHFVQAGQHDRAAVFGQRAGERAMARSAAVEAIRHFTNALEQLSQLPDTAERARRELVLRVKLGPALQMIHGPSAPETHANYARAQALGGRTGDTPELFMALWGLWLYANVRGESENAAARADELLSLALRLRDSDLLLEALHASVPTRFNGGEFEQAHANAKEAIRRYDPVRHRAHAFIFGGHDTLACMRGFNGLALWFGGWPDQARGMAESAIAGARALDHPFSLANAGWQAAILFQLLGDRTACREVSGEVVRLSSEHKFPWPLAMGTLLTGWALAETGAAEEGLARMTGALTDLQGIAEHLFRSYGLALTADIESRLGRADTALALIEEGLALAACTGQHFYEAELHRLRGEIEASSRDAVKPTAIADAEACFSTALGIARRQGARALELRASTSLARLWRDQGKRIEARDLLAPIYGWFTEGFDTPDLMEAKARLDELA
jgi:class 3 adenylate cyclase/predicted ATPase